MATNWHNCIYLATGDLTCKNTKNVSTIEHYADSIDPKNCCQNKKFNGLFSPSCVECIKRRPTPSKKSNNPSDTIDIYVDGADVFEINM